MLQGTVEALEETATEHVNEIARLKVETENLSMTLSSQQSVLFSSAAENDLVRAVELGRNAETRQKQKLALRKAIRSIGRQQPGSGRGESGDVDLQTYPKAPADMIPGDTKVTLCCIGAQYYTQALRWLTGRMVCLAKRRLTVGVFCAGGAIHMQRAGAQAGRETLANTVDCVWPADKNHLMVGIWDWIKLL